MTETAKKKAVVAGHICIDITPVFPEDTRRVSSPGDLLKPGSLINLSHADIHTGGAVANTGLAMKVMGADVRLMGKIGDDSFGNMIRDILNAYDAGTDLITIPGETSSYSIVVAVPGTDRIFLHCPGANDTFDGTEIPEAALSDTALFHFGYPTLMREMYRRDGDHLVEMFRKVHALQIAASLDLAAIAPNGPAASADWMKILCRVLPYTDFFVPSFDELCGILDPGHYQKLQEKAGNSDVSSVLSVEEDILPLCEKCLSLGAKTVLLKCGAPGLFLMTSDRMDQTGSRLGLDAHAWNGFRHFEKSYRADPIRSAAAAGDVTIGAFLTSLLEGLTPLEAAQNAAAAGALCCMSYDAVSTLKPLAEIRAMIDAGWEKADVR